MNVVILYGAVPADASLEDQDTLVQVEAVRQALERLGHRVSTLACTLDLAALRPALAAKGTVPCSGGCCAPLPENRDSPRPMVFNLVEALEGVDSLQYLATAVLDSLGVPYTGNPTEAIFQTTQKPLAKQLLHLAGLPTPAWLAAGAPREAATLRPPCILKAVWEHASRGLDEHSLITAGDAETVWARLAAACGAGVSPACLVAGDTPAPQRPYFAEQFIEGREFNLALLADGADKPEVLPPAEIDFSAFAAGKPRIVGYRAKWVAGSFEFDNTPPRFDFPAEDEPLLRELREIALRCWQLFGLRGYARVDFRVDLQGRPWILEVNTNPCLSSDAGFAAVLVRAGIGFDEAIERILGANR
jgi:D-alanine-D-alanine ligase